MFLAITRKCHPLFFLCWLSCPLSIQADDAKKESALARNNLQTNLETAIPEAIRLLETGDHAGLLKNFVKPEDYKKIVETQGLEKLTQSFANGKGKELLVVLKLIKGKTPRLEQNGTKAVFEIDKEKFPRGSISFSRIEKLWYIDN